MSPARTVARLLAAFILTGGADVHATPASESMALAADPVETTMVSRGIEGANEHHKIALRDDEIHRKLDTIVLPRIEAREASIHEMIEFFRDASIRHDTGDSGTARGIPIILDLPESETSQLDTRSIALNLRNIRLGDALSMLAEVIDADLSIRNGAVVVTLQDLTRQTGVAPSGIPSTDSSATTRPKQTSRHWAIEQRLDSIIIPTLVFRQARIQEIIAFLREASAAHDPAKPGAQRHVNIVLDLGGFDENQFAYPDNLGTRLSTNSPLPRITLNLSNVSLHDALRYLAEITGLQFLVRDDAAVLTLRDTSGWMVVSPTYVLRPYLVSVLNRFSDNGADPDRLKSWLTREAGVKFPSGAELRYDAELGTLQVTTEPSSVRTLELFLQALESENENGGE